MKCPRCRALNHFTQGQEPANECPRASHLKDDYAWPNPSKR
ncbi:Com family DNA-binding transcriptional regulator [Neisseriaceae bacterium TC5R-5]|nr:Com family DNA-binding transcriptional regulator [Neisseriaceae bacterium TC5R-5]